MDEWAVGRGGVRCAVKKGGCTSQGRAAAFSGEFIYILKEREFIKCNEPVLKIGRSSRLVDRIMQYPSGSMVHATGRVRDAKKAEEDVKLTFRGRFLQRRDLGIEYFEGDEDAMVDTFIRMLNKHRSTARVPPAEWSAECAVGVGVGVGVGGVAAECGVVGGAGVGGVSADCAYCDMMDVTD